MPNHFCHSGTKGGTILTQTALKNTEPSKPMYPTLQRRFRGFPQREAPAPSIIATLFSDHFNKLITSNVFGTGPAGMLWEHYGCDD